MLTHTFFRILLVYATTFAATATATTLFATTVAEETCYDSSDCANRDKICHENKCICDKDRPVEDQDRCLPMALVREICTIEEQCMGNSHCIDGYCDCGTESVGLFNPSAKIFYCHPKRELFQECNHDAQCPANSFCSTKKYGCLCQNGFGPTTVVSSDGNEVISCLPKLCTNSSTCESEYHQCEDNKCKCLATHFDPTSAKCYKFGSTGGLPNDDLVLQTNATNQDGGIYTILKDLTDGSDNLWLILFLLILLSIIFLVLFLVLLRKNCFNRCCWTANKNEYEPNNKNGTLKNGSNHGFDKNSINNKSFRKKTSETDDDLDDTTAADKSSLVSGSKKDNGTDNMAKKNKTPSSVNRAQAPTDRRGYISVDMNDDTGTNSHHKSSHQVPANSPLASSTSTPV